MSRLTSKTAHRWVAGAVAATITWTVTGAAWAIPCFKPAEVESKHVRLLQTELMVAALTCRHHVALGFDDKYNAFIRKFDKRLGHHIGVLRGYFKREYGGGFERQYDRFATDLANQASQRAHGGGAYCANSAWLFDEALGMPVKDLEGFAGSIQLASIANASSCEPMPPVPLRTQRTAAQPKNPG